MTQVAARRRSDRTATFRLATMGRGVALRPHLFFLILLAAGILLRVIAIVAYQPAILYVDSVDTYLNHLPGSTLPGATGPSFDPLGYNLFLLQPTLASGSLFTVVLVQHLLGIGMAVVIYAVALRRGAPRWLAALATAPVLLDAYQIYIEHMIMSDTLFEALLVAGFAAAVWHRRPGPWSLGIAGLFLGAAATVRSVGVPVLVVFLIYAMLLRGRVWDRAARTAALALAAVVPIAGYVAYSTTLPGHYATGATSARSLYARAAAFVDCDTLNASPAVKALCPVEPLGERKSPEYYANTPHSPVLTVKPPPGVTVQELETQFARAAMTQQPLRLTGAVLHDAARLFTWDRDNSANPYAPAERWRFQNSYPVYPDAVTLTVYAQMGAEFGGGPATLTTGAAIFMRNYQLSVGYVPGPFLAFALVIAVLGIVWRGRSRGAPARSATALYTIGAVVVLGAADFYEFSWRYQLPALILLPLAGVLGWTSLMWREQPKPFPTADDRAVIDAFRDAYGEPKLPPVVIVVAAYNEAHAIGPVLDALPRTTGGEDPLEVATLVIVDGATDDTAEIARQRAAFRDGELYVCELPTNRGQGAALRVGYFLARSSGAEYIVTTDADGQYDNSEMNDLLEPLRSGAADFVIGSRRLGDDHSRDFVRRSGVRFFGFMISVLCGTRVTDTSSGYRAFVARMTADVTLNQPQYQTSELLISALSHGYRVVERPVTMRKRAHGKSKKGNNLQFGYRYAKVVFGTWARERRTRRAETARERHEAVEVA